MESFAYLILRISALFLKGFMWLCLKLRLGIPLLYVAIVLIFFRDWYNANTQIGDYILFGMVGLCAISWVISFVRFIQRQRLPSASEAYARALVEQTITEQGYSNYLPED